MNQHPAHPTLVCTGDVKIKPVAHIRYVGIGQFIKGTAGETPTGNGHVWVRMPNKVATIATAQNMVHKNVGRNAFGGSGYGAATKK